MPGDTTLGRRVFAILATVPDNAAYIGLVVEDSCASAYMATNCSVAPLRAARSWDRRYARVEFYRNLLRRLALCIFFEDPANDLGLPFINLPKSGIRLPAASCSILIL